MDSGRHISADTSSERRTVTVTGHGTTPVVPDRAVVRVAATARARGVAEAFGSCSSGAAAIGEVARRHTLDEHIATTTINVWPWHDDQGRARGFEARHSLAIGCADLSAAGALLTELTDVVGDALAVEGVTLEVSSPVAAREQAVAEAYEDAVRQATQLAALAEARLGEVVAIDQGGSVQGGSLDHRAMADSAMIEPGATTIAASVRLTFALARRATSQSDDDPTEHRPSRAT